MMTTLIQQMIAGSNVTKILLFQQTMRTLQLKAQVEEDRKALIEARETIEALTAALLGATETYIC